MNFEGAFTAHVTPFDESGEVDLDSLAEFVDVQVGGGVDGLVTAGCTGEAATLSHEEHRDLIEKVVEFAGGRVPVVAGTGSNSTREALSLTRHAEDVGADGAMLITPYYNKPPQRGMYEHYREVAESVSIPIVLYNVPSRTGVNLLPETVLELAEVENVVAVKEASGDIGQISRLLEGAPDGFKVLSGDDSLTLPALGLGGHGVVSVAANLVPGEVSEMVERGLGSDLVRAKEVHRRLSPLFRALFLETNPIPVKRALEMTGIDVGKPRPPLTDLAGGCEGELRRTLEGLGLV